MMCFCFILEYHQHNFYQFPVIFRQSKALGLLPLLYLPHIVHQNLTEKRNFRDYLQFSYYQYWFYCKQ